MRVPLEGKYKFQVNTYLKSTQGHYKTIREGSFLKVTLGYVGKIKKKKNELIRNFHSKKLSMQYQFQKPFFTFHSDMKSSCIKKLNKDGIFQMHN